MILAGGPRRADIIAVGYVFDTAMPDGAWLAFGTELDPKGNAYVLVHEGRGTVASCIFTGFRDQAKHLAAMVSYFERRAGLQMQNARGFGGFGNVRLPRTVMRGGSLVIGEHAGFQDALAGFGLRYAMRTGRLAAEFGAGPECRRVQSVHVQPHGYTRIGLSDRKTRCEPHPIDIGFGLPAVVPQALRAATRPVSLSRTLKDRSCDHVVCDCVWCQHGHP